ncbi:holin [Enterococcus avium]|uniref:holin n=1 Tax=Enterococcus avium TaxID=33945 RepID=UPI0039A6E74D
MEQVINTILGTGISMSALVIILVEVAKKPNLIPSKWIAWVAVAIGVITGCLLSFVYPEVGSMSELAIAGVVSGAVASGIYNQVNKGGNE